MQAKLANSKVSSQIEALSAVGVELFRQHIAVQW